MTTPHPEDRPSTVAGTPAEEQIDPADAAERLEQDPDDVDRNREQAPTVAPEQGPATT